jgi:acetamidase/formamidase
MTLHTMKPERRTLHGHFSKDLPPALTIEPGDTVRFQTLDAGWGLEPFGEAQTSRQLFEPRTPGVDEGHALCGPVEIRDAEPGMSLEVYIGSLVPGDWGYTGVGGARPARLNCSLGVDDGERAIVTWTLDTDAMIGRSSCGPSVTLNPFMGVLGMPPAESGIHSTTPPRIWGGNIDCKELTQGSTLFLPVPVAGGLFSVGDGHAAQGDGEVSGTAIECPMRRADLTFNLREDMRLISPRAKTPTAWLTFGFHEDLNEAMELALVDMLALMTELFKLSRRDALALASVVVDLRITQVVNEVCGVHAVLPHGAMR